jgi:hypothetical protein
MTIDLAQLLSAEPDMSQCEIEVKQIIFSIIKYTSYWIWWLTNIHLFFQSLDPYPEEKIQEVVSLICDFLWENFCDVVWIYVIFVFLIIYCVYISCILCECVYINLMYCYIYCACLRVLLGWDWGLQNQRSVY